MIFQLSTVLRMYDATSGFLSLILEGKRNVCNGETKSGKTTKKSKKGRKAWDRV